MKHAFYSVLTLFLLALSRPTLAADVVSQRMDKCAQGLVPDEIMTYERGNLAESFRVAICGEWYKSHKEAADASLGLDALIDVVWFSGNYSQDSSTESIDKGKYCADTGQGRHTRTGDVVLQ
jgi:hypothetical protein